MSATEPLRHLRASTANKRPTPAAMADGQLALNTNNTSPGLFFKDSNGALVKVGPVHVGSTAPNASPAAGGSTGNAIGEQWLDTAGGTYVFKVWDGSAWRSESGTFVDVNGDVMTGALVMDNQQQVRFRETTANGINFIAIQAPASVSADRTLTLPDVTGTLVSTGDTGSVTSTMIADGTIVNADINASAAIAGTKISPDFGSQNVTTTGTSTSASFIPTSSTAPANGVYLSAANSVAISTDSTQRLLVDASGNVGVGSQFTLLQKSGTLPSTDQIRIRLQHLGGTRRDAAIRVTYTGGWTASTTGSRKGFFDVIAAWGLSSTNTFTYLRVNDIATRQTFTESGFEVIPVGSNNQVDVIIRNPSIDQHSYSVKIEVLSSTDQISVIDSVQEAKTSYVAMNTDHDLVARGTGSIRAITNDGERLRITSAGLVGIGTSSPSSLLALLHTASTAYSQNTEGLTLRGSSGTVNRFTSLNFDGSGYAGNIANVAGVTTTLGTSYANSAGALRFATKNTTDATPVDRLSITAAGNVGIGTTSPGKNIEIASTTASVQSQLYWNANNSDAGDVERGAYLFSTNRSNGTQRSWGIYGHTNSLDTTFNSSLIFKTVTSGTESEKVRIDNGGRLLVGTSSNPSAGLGQYALAVVQGYAGGTTGEGILSIARGKAATALVNTDTVGQLAFTDNAGNTFAKIVSFVDGTVSSTSDLPGALSFSTTADGASSPTERMRIRNNGDTTIYCGGYSGIESATTDSNTEVLRLFTGASNSSNNKIIQILASGGQGRGIIYSGNSVSQAPYFAAASDRRLKTNIREYTEGYEKIKAIPVKLYDEIDGKKNIAGWIADEVQQVIPSAVNGAPNAVDSESNPIYQSLGTANFIPDMVQALQAAIAKIEALEAEVAALKAQ